MRTGRVSNGVAGDWLADLIVRSTHLALMGSDPFLVGDPLTVELAVARVPVSWAISGRLLRNTNALVWAGIVAGSTVFSIAGFNAAFNGDMAFSAPVTNDDLSPLTFPAGGGLEIAIAEFFVGLNA